MGIQERERKHRILTGEELSFKRKSLMRRLDVVYHDMYMEYGLEGLVYMHKLSLSSLQQLVNPKGGC